jgi:glycosyltransferase involved in cell wall biosynthesis
VNHTATVGGGERSLLELLQGLPTNILPALACPEGELALAARKMGMPVAPIPEMVLSFRLAPVGTTRGLANLVRAAAAVQRAERRFDADLVHANSVRAGLIVTSLRPFARAPAVVHVRDALPAGATASLVRRAISSGAALVIANSEFTATKFAESGSRDRVRAIHNAVDLERFDPTGIDREVARSRLGLGPRTVALGVIAQISPWKAQDDALRALAVLRQYVPDVRLLIVGSARFARGAESFDNRAFERSLHELVTLLSLEAAVDFLGERSDVPDILRALDLLLVPSWQEPFGRSIIEAMAMGVPVIATNSGGPAEIVTDGVDGVLLEPRQPERWAKAAASLVGTPDRLRTIAIAARRTAAVRFGRDEHVAAVAAAYRHVLNGAAP